MSLNRDKESDKEIANKEKDFIAKAKEFSIALTPEQMIEKVIDVNPDLEKAFSNAVSDNEKIAESLVKANLDLAEANDLLEFKDDQIKTFAEQLEKATEQLVESEEVYNENISLVAEVKQLQSLITQAAEKNESDTVIIKGLTAKNLKLKNIVKQFTETTT